MAKGKAKSNAAYGDGGVSNRSDGYFTASLYVNGKRVSRTCRDEKRAWELLEELRKMRDAGVNILDADRLTVDGLVEWHIEMNESMGRWRASTAATYRRLCKDYISPHIGKTRVLSLKATQVQAAVNQLKRQGLSARTIHLVIGLLSAAIKTGINQDLLLQNVVRKVVMPKIDSYEATPLTAEQVDILLDRVRGSRYEALMWVLISTGMRIGEALSLTWDDVDLDTGEVHIRVSKSKSGIRSVLLTDNVLRILGEHKLLIAKERLMMGAKWQDGELKLVFPSTVGTIMGRPSLHGIFRRILNDAGLPESVRIHDLRHTAATLLLSANMPVHAVSKYLGHSNPSITLNTYAHLLDSTKTEIALKMGEILGDRKVS